MDERVSQASEASSLNDGVLAVEVERLVLGGGEAALDDHELIGATESDTSEEVNDKPPPIEILSTNHWAAQEEVRIKPRSAIDQNDARAPLNGQRKDE